MLVRQGLRVDATTEWAVVKYEGGMDRFMEDMENGAEREELFTSNSPFRTVEFAKTVIDDPDCFVEEYLVDDSGDFWLGTDYDSIENFIDRMDGFFEVGDRYADTDSVYEITGVDGSFIDVKDIGDGLNDGAEYTVDDAEVHYFMCQSEEWMNFFRRWENGEFDD